jgi:type IV secretory pathway TrbD component
MKKSYHSIVVPTALASATRRDSDVGPIVNVMYHRRAYHAAGLPRSMRNVILGLLCAAALALALSDLAIFGIAIWKIELAIVGMLLFVTAGRKAS